MSPNWLGEVPNSQNMGKMNAAHDKTNAFSAKRDENSLIPFHMTFF